MPLMCALSVSGEIGTWDLSKNLSSIATLAVTMRKMATMRLNIMQAALNRELAKTQLEKLGSEIRRIMVYESPKELGNLYTRVNQMRVIIMEEQEQARLAQEKKEREIEWQRRKVINAIQDKAIYGAVTLFFVLYLILFFSLLVMDRKTRWGF